MDAAMAPVINTVRDMNERLLAEGWVQINPFELATEDRKLWFGTTYVTGEYTLHASHRREGFGAARGNIRVRLTPALVQHHPELGRLLITDLLNAQVTIALSGFDDLVWPPPAWSELSIQGVVDYQ